MEQKVISERQRQKDVRRRMTQESKIVRTLLDGVKRVEPESISIVMTGVRFGFSAVEDMSMREHFGEILRTFDDTEQKLFGKLSPVVRHLGREGTEHAFKAYATTVASIEGYVETHTVAESEVIA